uniref:Transmembrane protein n=1 Tax=Marseillevirus LCMAC101 TaxID=2506602 RepID=A0A481YSU1_9VIRU|nr:MAG: uncharacterized protein LCMAC101_06120 [Marseillevirus LCMAC101]
MDQNAHDQWIVARSKLWTPDLDKLLRKWKTQVGKKERGHRELARKYTRRHYMFGLPAVILATLITAGAFATFQECGECDDRQSTQCKAEVWVRLTIGILGIISIGLTSSVTFVNYQQIAEDHKSAADMFGERFRQIDSLLLIPGPFRGDPITVLQNIRSQYDNDVRNAPVLPKKYDYELTYNVIPHKPPSPGQVNIVIDPERKRRETAILGKLLTDEEESSDGSVTIPINEALDQRNQYDTDGEEDVCIGFDLDAVPDYTQTTAALAVAALTAKKRQQEQESLQNALKFELRRMEMHTQKLQYGKKRSGRKKVKERGKVKSKAEDSEEDVQEDSVSSEEVKEIKKEKASNRHLNPKDERSEKENVQGEDSSSSEDENN